MQKLSEIWQAGSFGAFLLLSVCMAAGQAKTPGSADASGNSPAKDSAKQAADASASDSNTSAQDSWQLELVAETPYQWTGVAVSSTGRIFVNFPSWKVPSPFKVAELVDGKLRAYPDSEFNKKLVCVQSVVIDANQRLYVLDTGNEDFKGMQGKKACLYVFDLMENKLLGKYEFSAEVASDNCYLNDLRVDEKRQIAYLTDSGMGGIVVLDLVSGKNYKALDHSVAATQADLKSLEFKSTGTWSNVVHSDGIELSKDKNTLYFTALTGSVLYSIPTQVLRNSAISMQEREQSISKLNDKNVPTDGLWLKGDYLYMADLPAEGLWRVNTTNGKGEPLNLPQGTQVKWADSFSQDQRGVIYFTTSAINFAPDKKLRYGLWRLLPKEQ